MLTKETVIGLVTITELRQIQVREDLIVHEDEIEVSRTYHRYILEPGDDISAKDEFIQELAEMLWTDEVVQAYKEHRAKFGPNFSGAALSDNRGAIRSKSDDGADVSKASR